MSRSIAEEISSAISRGEALNKFYIVGANLSERDLSWGNFVRADCTRTRFVHSNLSHSNFNHANLTGAVFYKANCENVDFHHTNFLGANFLKASIANANFVDAKNLLCLPIGDPRGCRPIAIWHYDHWRIFSGCRYTTFNYYGDRNLGNQYLEALNWLEKQSIPT